MSAGTMLVPLYVSSSFIKERVSDMISLGPCQHPPIPPPAVLSNYEGM